MRVVQIKCFVKDFILKIVFLFGDNPQDMNAGYGAGITTIGITTGIYDKTELKNSNADFVIDSDQQSCASD